MLKTAISCCPSPPTEATLNVGGADFKRCRVITQECLTLSLARAALGGIFHLPLPGWEASFFRFAALWLPCGPDCICSNLRETRTVKPKVCFAHEAQAVPASTNSLSERPNNPSLRFTVCSPRKGDKYTKRPFNLTQVSEV